MDLVFKSMSEVYGKNLEKQLRIAVKTGKFIVGRREVSKSIKGSKLLVWSSSANLPPDLLNQTKTLQIPSIRFTGNPVQLGRACGIPFRVSVIAIKSAGDSDISSFESARDYSGKNLPSTSNIAPPHVEGAEKLGTASHATESEVERAEVKRQKATDAKAEEKKSTESSSSPRESKKKGKQAKNVTEAQEKSAEKPVKTRRKKKAEKEE